MNTNEQTEPIFVRISEAARLLSMSRSAAYEAIRAGAIPAVRVAGKWRVPLAALKRLAERAGAAAQGSEDGEAGPARPVAPLASHRGEPVRAALERIASAIKSPARVTRSAQDAGGSES